MLDVVDKENIFRIAKGVLGQVRFNQGRAPRGIMTKTVLLPAKEKTEATVDAVLPPVL